MKLHSKAGFGDKAGRIESLCTGARDQCMSARTPGLHDYHKRKGRKDLLHEFIDCGVSRVLGARTCHVKNLRLR